MTDIRIESWLAERRSIHAAATERLYFQPWGPQNQNGDYAESILMDGRTGESLAYGLPDADGAAYVDAHNHLPAFIAMVEAVLKRHQRGQPYLLAVEWVCKGCSIPYEVTTTWPCPTIQAIEGAIDE